jgi:outer membrane protein assembly factor BamB
MDGRVFVGVGNTILALNSATGERLWRSTPGPKIQGTARLLARDGRVFASFDDAAAFDASTGRLLWSRALTDPDVVANALDESTLYVGTRGHVLALDAVSGTMRWDFAASEDWPLGGRVSGIATSGDTIYVSARKNQDVAHGGRSGVILALRRSDGALIWRWESPLQTRASDVTWAPSIVGRLIVAATVLNNEIFALDRFAREEIWRTTGAPSGGNFEGVALASDTVFSGSLDGTAAAHDLMTGRLLWRSPKTAASITAVDLCDDRVVVVNEGFETLDRRSGERRLSGLHGAGDFIISGPIAGQHVVYMTGVVAVYAFECK